VRNSNVINTSTNTEIFNGTDNSDDNYFSVPRNMMLFTTQLSLSLETHFTTFRYSLFSEKIIIFELCSSTLLHSLQSGLNAARLYAAAVIK